MAALRNLAVAWRPFAEAGHAVVIGAGGALVMAWDAAAARQAQAAGGLGAEELRVLPESLLFEPINDGVRLQGAIDGVDGQHWQQGELLASRWWPEPPSAAEWHNFLREAKLAGDGTGASVPAVQPMRWLGSPWARPRALDALAGSGARWQSLATMAVTACLVATTAAQAHRWITVERGIDQLRDDKLAQDTTLGPALAARDRALQQLAQVQGLASRLVAPQPLEVMQHLSEVLPARGVLLKELELNGTKLRLGLDAADGVARSTLIRQLQSGGWLKDVAETKDGGNRGGLSLEMTVDGAQPAAVRAANPGAAPIATGTPTLPPEFVSAVPATPRGATPAAQAKLPGSP